MNSELTELSTYLIKQLGKKNQQLVFAESCTAGLVASSLAGVPGASAVLVGSAVVYQVKTKQQWLKISEDHFSQFDVVSGETSHAMAKGILEQTPWATVGAAITGHLGPDAPEHLDGIAWGTVIVKSNGSGDQVVSRRLVLDKQSTKERSAIQRRHERQIAAARQLMEVIIEAIGDTDDLGPSEQEVAQ